MKSKVFVIICLLGFSVLFLSRDYSSAQSRSVSSKIGVVNIEKVSANCKATENFKKIIDAEREKMDKEEAELEQKQLTLEKELTSGALKYGSDTFIARQRALNKTMADLQFLREFNQLRQPRHTAVFFQDLAYHPYRSKARHLQVINSRFRMPRSYKHSSFLRPKRKDMARLDKIRRAGILFRK